MSWICTVIGISLATPTLLPPTHGLGCASSLLPRSPLTYTATIAGYLKGLKLTDTICVFFLSLYTVPSTVTAQRSNLLGFLDLNWSWWKYSRNADITGICGVLLRRNTSLASKRIEKQWKYLQQSLSKKLRRASIAQTTVKWPKILIVPPNPVGPGTTLMCAQSERKEWRVLISYIWNNDVGQMVTTLSGLQ